MSPRQATKNVATFVVGAGTSRIVGKLITKNVQPETTTDYVTMVPAAGILGMMAADKTRPAVESLVDDVFDVFEAFKKTRKNHN